MEEITTATAEVAQQTSEPKEEFRIQKKVKVKDFNEEYIDIVPYSESIIGDSDETTYENYINLHGQMYPEILESMQDGIHKMEEAESYISDYVRERHLAKNRNVAAVSSNTIFALLINYYMSPVVEEKVKFNPIPTYKPSTSYTPLTPEQIEANRKKREQEEAERKEKARLDELRKKQEEKNKLFAGTLFGF